jgi:DHA1 family bicyclomycin/chloramphenicol resistance-like MFS transporter
MSPSSRRVDLRLIAVLGGLCMFPSFAIDLYLPGLPVLADDLHTTASAAGLTLTACLIGLAAGQLVAGPVSDARGRLAPLFVGQGMMVVASLLCALSPTITALVALRFVQGFAGASGLVIARAIVRDMRSGEAASRLFSTLMLFTGLGPLLGPFVGSQLLRFTDWRGVFVVIAAIGVLMGLAALSTLPETLPRASRHTGGLAMTLRTFRTLLGDRQIVGCALVAAMTSAALFSQIAGAPFVLQDQYGLTETQFGLVFALNAVGVMTAGQLSARLVGRLGPTRLLGVGVAISALAGLWLVVTLSTGALGLVGVIVGQVSVVAAVGFVNPNATAIALAGHPSTAGSASALLGVSQFSLGALGAPLVGIGGTSVGVSMAVVIAVLGLGAVTAFLRLVWPVDSEAEELAARDVA